MIRSYNKERNTMLFSFSFFSFIFVEPSPPTDEFEVLFHLNCVLNIF